MKRESWKLMESFECKLLSVTFGFPKVCYFNLKRKKKKYSKNNIFTKFTQIFSLFKNLGKVYFASTKENFALLYFLENR